MSNMPNDFNSFNNPNQFPQPPKKSNKLLWIILAIVLGLIVLCCGGFFALSYFGAQAMSGFVGEAIKQQVASSPELQAEVGEVESVTMNIQETQKRGKAVFDVKGSTGSGKIIMDDKAGNGNQPSVIFESSDGRTVPLQFEEVEEPNIEIPGLDSDVTTEAVPAPQ